MLNGTTNQQHDCSVQFSYLPRPWLKKTCRLPACVESYANVRKSTVKGRNVNCLKHSIICMYMYTLLLHGNVPTTISSMVVVKSPFLKDLLWKLWKCCENLSEHQKKNSLS